MIVILIKRKKHTQKKGGFAIDVKINVKINEEKNKTNEISW